MKAKLGRSRTNRMIGGVCGGLGPYLNLDPVVVRLIFVVLALANGVGVLIYMVLWFITPLEGQDEAASVEETARASADEIAARARAMGDDLRRAVSSPNPQAGLIVGAILVGLGIVFLLQNLNIGWLWWLDKVFWPLILIVLGIVLLSKAAKTS